MTLKPTIVEGLLFFITLALGFLSYTFDDQWARGLFGASLVIDMYLLTRRILTGLEKQAIHEYLATGEGIWDRAIRLIDEAERLCTLRGTSSSPNLPAFEEKLIKKILASGLTYKRTMCFHSPSRPLPPNPLPPVTSISGETKDKILKSYLRWYDKFYKTWNENKSIDNAIAMALWHDALSRLKAHIPIHLTHHQEGLPADFLILQSREGRYVAALLAFPRHKGETNGSGFRTKDSRLAKDFDLNLDRLLN